MVVESTDRRYAISAGFRENPNTTCGPAVPVSCTLTAPSTVTHAPTTTGRITSTADGDISVQCTRKTSVNLSVADSTLPLMHSSGKGIRSTLGLGSRDAAQTIVTADPVAHVKLRSKIDSATDIGGRIPGRRSYTCPGISNLHGACRRGRTERHKCPGNLREKIHSVFPGGSPTGRSLGH